MTAIDMQLACRSIRVRGQVQGVGFRPFVWQVARRLSLAGSVANDGEGVIIHAAGPDAALDALVQALRAEAPPLARITAVEVAEGNARFVGTDFVIAASGAGAAATGIAADAATCPACLAELFDEEDRRFGYAFGNCTHCGPRLTIIRAVPYDRASTSMAQFGLCDDCAREYADPADRRFHAQPTACPACGPRLWLDHADGEAGARITANGEPIQDAARLLRAGRIVAIKGLGGFHLSCRAADPLAVSELRRRKARDAKPFALMVGSLEQAERLCHVTPEQAQVMQSTAAPILLLARREDTPPLPADLAPDQDHLGIMLPYTPLHHLLMAAVGEPLVMTSGNRSDEPQETDNDDARRNLAGIADAWLMHDRAIVNRVDDSVVAFDARGPMVLRRARGLAPDPILLPASLDCGVPVLAMGGELKATFCLLRGNEAIVSPHIGDLEDARALDDYRRMLDLMRQLYAFTPDIIAVDGHADYLSTQLGMRLAAELQVPVVAVAHHHAHMAACLAEHGVAADDTAHGIICDGLGLGADGTLWGGEVLRGGYAAVDRVGAMPAIPLPGGGAAMKQPWRNLVAHLVGAFGADWRGQARGLTDHLPDDATVAMVERAMTAGINSPPCSSAGRLFDAVAASVGIHPLRISHEGQAAMALEALARPHMADAAPYPLSIRHGAQAPRLMLRDLWHGIASDRAAGAHAGQIAARFHRSFCDMMTALLPEDGQPGGAVALSGGVLQNRIVRECLATAVESRGLRPMMPHIMPAGDGGLSLGQAAVAAARQIRGILPC